MSWNFILLIFINVCQVRWIVICIPGLTYLHSCWGTSLRECPGIIKTMHTGFSAYTYCIMPTPRCWHERNRTLWFSVGRICVVFWMLSVNIVELSKGIVISFMFMDICNQSEEKTPALARFSLYCLKCDFSWFQPIIGRFYKMRVSWEFNIYNLFLSPFINTVLSFSNTMWILSVAR